MRGVPALTAKLRGKHLKRIATSLVAILLEKDNGCDRMLWLDVSGICEEDPNKLTLLDSENHIEPNPSGGRTGTRMLKWASHSATPKL